MLVPVLRPLSLGEVLDTSFGLVRRLFVPLIIVSVATQTVPLALGVFVQSAGGVVAQPALWALSVGLAVVLGAIGTAASTFLIAETYLGSSLTPQEAFLRSTPFMGRLIGASLLVTLMVSLGSLLLLIPGVIAFCGLIVTPSAMVLEDIYGATNAMGRSWALTKGFRLKIFGAVLVAFLLLTIPGIALGALAVTAASVLGEETALLAMMLAVAVLQMLVYPFFYSLTTVIYYDLRVRKEGFDLEMLASSLQPG